MKNILTAFLILLQRTDIQNNFLSGKFRSTYAKFNILSTLVILANSFRHKKIFQLYYESIKKESELICNLVTDNFKKRTKIIILDIGCGIAGYHSNFLNLKSKSTYLYLMDNSEFNLKALRYGFGASNRYYNSLHLAKNFLSKNNCSSGNSIFLIETKKDFPHMLPIKIDLVVSFISWGFHYPLEEYWEAILNRINYESIIVLDVRRGTKSFNFLYSQNNCKIDLIESYDKYDRVKITGVRN